MICMIILGSDAVVAGEDVVWVQGRLDLQQTRVVAPWREGKAGGCVLFVLFVTCLSVCTSIPTGTSLHLLTNMFTAHGLMPVRLTHIYRNIYTHTHTHIHTHGHTQILTYDLTYIRTYYHTHILTYRI